MSELVFVGYTNGHQIKYAREDEGVFYPDTDNECYIPLYMLKTHLHRIESTSDFNVTLEEIFDSGQLENRIVDLERQLKAEREINDRLRVVETERAVRNDELYEALGELVGALYSSYDATEWPADGTSHQEVTALKGKATLEKHKNEYGERPLRYIAAHPNGTTSGFLHETKDEIEKIYKPSMSDWEIIPIRVSGDYDDSH